jgi:hypothetical protein
VQGYTPPIRRRSERRATTVPIGLAVKADRFKTDDSATTLDISLHGARVRTKLALVAGEWVGVSPKREFPYAVNARVVWAREDGHSHWTYAGIELSSSLEV